jgi:hypothetical protein
VEERLEQLEQQRAQEQQNEASDLSDASSVAGSALLSAATIQRLGPRASAVVQLWLLEKELGQQLRLLSVLLVQPLLDVAKGAYISTVIAHVASLPMSIDLSADSHNDHHAVAKGTAGASRGSVGAAARGSVGTGRGSVGTGRGSVGPTAMADGAVGGAIGVVAGQKSASATKALGSADVAVFLEATRQISMMVNALVHRLEAVLGAALDGAKPNRRHTVRRKKKKMVRRTVRRMVSRPVLVEAPAPAPALAPAGGGPPPPPPKPKAFTEGAAGGAPPPVPPKKTTMQPTGDSSMTMQPTGGMEEVEEEVEVEEEEEVEEEVEEDVEWSAAELLRLEGLCVGSLFVDSSPYTLPLYTVCQQYATSYMAALKIVGSAAFRPIVVELLMRLQHAKLDQGLGIPSMHSSANGFKVASAAEASAYLHEKLQGRGGFLSLQVQ